MTNIANKTARGMMSWKRKRMIFYTLGVLFPIAQFLVFYGYVHLDSFMLCVEEYNMFGANAGQYTWAGLNNFKEVISDFINYPSLSGSILRGLLCWGLGTAYTFVNLLVGWYIVKKKPFSQVALTVMFIPGILSPIAQAAITKYFLCDAAPAIVLKFTGKVIPSLMDNNEPMKTFFILFADGYIMGVTSGCLLYAGTMNSVSDSIIEAAKLDGITPFKEFILIYLPLMTPTLSVIFFTGLAGILTSDPGLFAYFGEGAPGGMWTVGYYLTVKTKQSTYQTYPYVSAMGFLISVFTVPATIIGKKLCDKVVERCGG